MWRLNAVHVVVPYSCSVSGGPWLFCCSVVVGLVVPVVLVLDINGFVFSVAVHVVVPVVVVLGVGLPLQGCWGVRACVQDVWCRVC